MVVPVCNLSYAGGIGRSIVGQAQLQAKTWDPTWKIKRKNRTGRDSSGGTPDWPRVQNFTTEKKKNPIRNQSQRLNLRTKDSPNTLFTRILEVLCQDWGWNLCMCICTLMYVYFYILFHSFLQHGDLMPRGPHSKRKGVRKSHFVFSTPSLLHHIPLWRPSESPAPIRDEGGEQNPPFFFGSTWVWT
jgi:hypothetical protein